MKLLEYLFLSILEQILSFLIFKFCKWAHNDSKNEIKDEIWTKDYL